MAKQSVSSIRKEGAVTPAAKVAQTAMPPTTALPKIASPSEYWAELGLRRYANRNLRWYAKVDGSVAYLQKTLSWGIQDAIHAGDTEAATVLQSILHEKLQGKPLIGQSRKAKDIARADFLESQAGTGAGRGGSASIAKNSDIPAERPWHYKYSEGQLGQKDIALRDFGRQVRASRGKQFATPDEIARAKDQFTRRILKKEAETSKPLMDALATVQHHGAEAAEFDPKVLAAVRLIEKAKQDAANQLKYDANVGTRQGTTGVQKAWTYEGTNRPPENYIKGATQAILTKQPPPASATPLPKPRVQGTKGLPEGPPSFLERTTQNTAGIMPLGPAGLTDAQLDATTAKYRQRAMDLGAESLLRGDGLREGPAERQAWDQYNLTETRAAVHKTQNYQAQNLDKIKHDIFGQNRDSMPVIFTGNEAPEGRAQVTRYWRKKKGLPEGVPQGETFLDTPDEKLVNESLAQRIQGPLTGKATLDKRLMPEPPPAPEGIPGPPLKQPVQDWYKRPRQFSNMPLAEKVRATPKEPTLPRRPQLLEQVPLRPPLPVDVETRAWPIPTTWTESRFLPNPGFVRDEAALARRAKPLLGNIANGLRDLASIASKIPR